MQVKGVISVTCRHPGVFQHFQESRLAPDPAEETQTLPLSCSLWDAKIVQFIHFLTWPKITVKRNGSELIMRKNKAVFFRVKLTRERKWRSREQWQDNPKRQGRWTWHCLIWTSPAAILLGSRRVDIGMTAGKITFHSFSWNDRCDPRGWITDRISLVATHWPPWNTPSVAITWLTWVLGTSQASRGFGLPTLLFDRAGWQREVANVPAGGVCFGTITFVMSFNPGSKQAVECLSWNIFGEWSMIF